MPPCSCCWPSLLSCESRVLCLCQKRTSVQKGGVLQCSCLPEGVGHRRRDPAIPSTGAQCSELWPACLEVAALGSCSFGSLPNLIKGLYVPACTLGPGLETKGHWLGVNEPWTHCSAAILAGMLAALPSFIGAADSSNGKGMRVASLLSAPGLAPAFPISFARRKCDLQHCPTGIPRDSPKASTSKESSSVIHLFNKYLLNVCCELGTMPGSHYKTWEARGVYNDGSQNQRPETLGLAPALP